MCLNVSADTNLSFIVTNEILRLSNDELKRLYPGSLRKRTREFSNAVFEFQNCKQQSFTLTMCFSMLVSSNWQDPERSQFGSFLQNVMNVNFRDWFFAFQHWENHPIARMFIITRLLSTPRDV